MTDYEKLKILLGEFGVEFAESVSEYNGRKLVHCVHGMKKVSGYPRFGTCFEFHPNGTFIEMGAWE